MAPRILIVEDDPTLCTLFAFVLEDAGFTIATASDGTTALHMLADERFDLLVLDINLPDISGLTVLQRLRQEPRLNHLKVVIASANVIGARTEEAEMADIVLIKPVRNRQLVDIAHRLLNGVNV
jgi:CheY-like chemotaxis protein